MVVRHLTGMKYRGFELSAPAVDPPHKALKRIAKELKEIEQGCESPVLHSVTMCVDSIDEGSFLYTVLYASA